MTPDGPLVPESLSPAARERVVERLKQLFAADELDLPAFEAKLERVFAARTAGELDAVAATLPAAPAHADVPAVAGTMPTVVSAFFSGHQQAVVTTVPQPLLVRAMLGYVELDLTAAAFPPGVTIIDVRAFLGYVSIRLPAGVRVESAGKALFGYFSHAGAEPLLGPSAEQRVVRIVGRALFGYAESAVGAGD